VDEINFPPNMARVTHAPQTRDWVKPGLLIGPLTCPRPQLDGLVYGAHPDTHVSRSLPRFLTILVSSPRHDVLLVISRLHPGASCHEPPATTPRHRSSHHRTHFQGPLESRRRVSADRRSSSPSSQGSTPETYISRATGTCHSRKHTHPHLSGSLSYSLIPLFADPILHP
jgi:hypothetical protein